MLFGKRTNLFGLDIGSNALKLAETHLADSQTSGSPDVMLELAELLLGLAGKANDDIGPDSDIRHGLSYLS